MVLMLTVFNVESLSIYKPNVFTLNSVKLDKAISSYDLVFSAYLCPLYFIVINQLVTAISLWLLALKCNPCSLWCP